MGDEGIVVPCQPIPVACIDPGDPAVYPCREFDIRHFVDMGSLAPAAQSYLCGWSAMIASTSTAAPSGRLGTPTAARE